MMFLRFVCCKVQCVLTPYTCLPLSQFDLLHRMSLHHGRVNSLSLMRKYFVLSGGSDLRMCIFDANPRTVAGKVRYDIVYLNDIMYNHMRIYFFQQHHRLKGVKGVTTFSQERHTKGYCRCTPIKWFFCLCSKIYITHFKSLMSLIP